jgi:2-pyrone-4,6-dicarboxylate lactonase
MNHTLSAPQAAEAAQRRPRQLLPAGAIDCHAHIFDQFDRYPLAGGRKYHPVPAPREAWLTLLERLGAARGVVVHPSPYGFDNSITEDFIRAHPDRLRGVAVVHPDIDEGRLRELDAAGFRAARLMDQFSTGATTAMLEAIARRVAPYGWHIEINITRSDDWVGLEPRLRNCVVPLVFDHLGRVRGNEGVQAPGFAVVRRLLAERDDCWVKMSSWYRLSDSGAPACTDMRALAQTLLAERPDRCVWATNWPHSGFDGTLPDDVDLVDQLDGWLPPGDAVRRALYVTNAEKLYRFAPS